MIEVEPKTEMEESIISKVYDLEDRTKQFAKDCRTLVRAVLKDISNREDGKQLVRSSGSVAANYIEANEALSKKDFVYRLKVCRKEAKESKLWLDLILAIDDDQIELQKKLNQESNELLRIFSSIILKSE
jgi:four helix bundle protein